MTLMHDAPADRHRPLRVLMYHKVNDIPDNPTTVPVGRFDEQLGRLAELGYQVVDLEAVLDHYMLGRPLPEKAVRTVVDAVRPYPFDRIYGGWWQPVLRTGAREAFESSVRRYLEFLRGDAAVD